MGAAVLDLLAAEQFTGESPGDNAGSTYQVDIPFNSNYSILFC
ncbi:hypothetical protein [Microbulbifer sp. SSSA002]